MYIVQYTYGVGVYTMRGRNRRRLLLQIGNIVGAPNRCYRDTRAEQFEQRKRGEKQADERAGERKM